MIGFHPQPKPESRLQDRKATKKDRDKAERDFKMAVWLRDGAKCRHCGRKVIKSVERIPNRGEVHHIHGRHGGLRFEVRAAILLCLEDHERCTGRVAEKWLIRSGKRFQLTWHGCDFGPYIDATYPVSFKRVA